MIEKSSSSSVSTRGLIKQFRHVIAVDQLSFTLSPGDVVALLGPNGSGKTTTFRMLLNIYHPTSGHIELNGIDHKEAGFGIFEDIAFISENQTFPKWMSVNEYCEFVSNFYSDWDHSFLEELFLKFKLPVHQKIKFLSRGQLMKVAIASVLPARPSIVLLDEPFSGLDVETRAILRELLQELSTESKLTILITTHDVEEVETLANRILLLDQGCLVEDETMQSYLDRHRCLVIEESQVEEISEIQKLNVYRKMSGSPSHRWYCSNFSEVLEIEVQALNSKWCGEAPGILMQRLTLREILQSKAL